MFLDHSLGKTFQDKLFQAKENPKKKKKKELKIPPNIAAGFFSPQAEEHNSNGFVFVLCNKRVKYL